jgi:hypothetical protein
VRAKLSSISIALAALFFTQPLRTPTARAQTPAAPASREAESKAEALKTVEAEALKLLGETVAAARGLKLAENRARVLATASGLLWTRDEKAARALFKEAAELVAALAASREGRQPEDGVHTVSALRQEMLSMVVNRDAQLALDFLRATRQPSPDRSQNWGGGRQPDPELAMEVNLAAQFAAQDPKLAARLAEESLSKGFSSGLGRILQLLVLKDPEAASRLAGLIVKRLSPEDLANDYEATNLASYLLTMTRVAAAPASPQAGDGVEHRMELGRVTVDEPTRRRLVETVLTAALSDGAARTGFNLYRALQPILPEVEKYAPARLPALRRQSAVYERNLDPHSRMMRDYRTVFEQGTVEAIVEAASKAPAEVRDQLYMQAFWRVAGEGDGERARQIAESISNPQQRAQLLQDLERQLPWRALERGSFEEARQLIMRLPAAEERPPMLLQLAGSLISKGEKEAARALLEEVAGMIVAVAGRARGHQQFNSQLELARLYAQLDEGRAFQLVEVSTEQLNELIAAAAVLEGFYQDSFRDGELRQQGGYVWNDLVHRCSAALAQLAPSDFARARATVERFQRVDVRVMAQLAFVRDVLSATTPHGNQSRLENLPLHGRRKLQVHF